MPEMLTGDEETQDELPDDYEVCGTCGYDHAYEQEEAAKVPHDVYGE